MAKKTLAMIGLTGCSGCSISVLDMEEDLLDVLGRVDLVYGTTLLDTKDFDHVDLCIVEGCVANEHDLENVKKAREKSDIIVALGSCACFGGINGLRNLNTVESVLERSYIKNETTVQGKIPSGVPKLLPKVLTVDSVIEVDYKIPGCPPISELIKTGLIDILNGKEIEEPNSNLCSECERIHKRMLIPQREFLSFDIINPIEAELENDLCFLEQGVLCLGIVTKAGCGGRCLHVDMPCRGCMGPPKKARDQGALAINALASILPVGILAEREDLIGTTYRYTIPHSSIMRSKEGINNRGK